MSVYHKILVPLDGSSFAEQALPHAVDIAATGEIEIVLLSVAPILDDQGLSVVDMYPVYVYRDYLVNQNDETERIRSGLHDYLQQAAQKLQGSGHLVTTVIRFGQPAEEIIACTQELGCDLVVMSTHGRSGIGRWVYGSVADKVLRGSTVPILLVRVLDASS